MKDFRIFTESKADIKFITDYVDEHFNALLPKDTFFVLNSWSGYKAGGNILEDIRRNFDNRFETILILDADNNFDQRRLEVLNDFERYEIPIHLFLFPNHSSSGNLENLLCEIAVERKLIQCFEAYEHCVAGYEAPVIKSKVFAYLDALLPAKNKKNNKEDLLQEANRNYRNTAHWNLQHEFLQPLHRFLSEAII